ncbi:putative ribonuclease H-like domain-containing protein [Tanacetum coccineum]
MQTEHTNNINTVSTPVSTAVPSFTDNVPSSPVNTAGPSVSTANAFEEHVFNKIFPLKNASALPHVPNVYPIHDTRIFGNAYDDEDVEEEVDMNNVASSYTVPDVPFTKFHKDHPKNQVIGSLKTHVQTRHMTKINEEHGLISSVHKLKRTNHKDFQNCLFACFLSQMEPKKPVQALKDPSWVEAMQDELLQFKLLKFWTLVDLPKEKWAIGTKWVFRNKKDERGIVVKNKARLVTQGYTQEEGIDYDEVFAPIARIEAKRLFLAYASFKDFVVYQMDVKGAFLYRKIEDEVYVCQPPGFEDPNFPDKVYKVEKALYGLHQAPRAWYETLSTYLLDNGFHRGQIDKTLFIKRHKDDILLVQVYVDDIIFGSTKKELSTEFEKLMHDKFQISSMGELTFLLGLQVQ